VKDELLAAIPRLRVLAITLTRHSDRADDLVQETLLKGWAKLARYERGTSMRAWLFTIMRNAFYTQCRKKREVEDRDGTLAAALSTPARQNGHMDFEGFRIAAAQIPAEQREALALVGGSGFSYREAAAVCGCPIGTVKSRISRARSRLAEILGLEAQSKVQHLPRSRTSDRTDLTPNSTFRVFRTSLVCDIPNRIQSQRETSWITRGAVQGRSGGNFGADQPTPSPLTPLATATESNTPSIGAFFVTTKPAPSRRLTTRSATIRVNRRAVRAPIGAPSL
jgi:RNA polymerase sigma-70 factor, ECF subfamily